MRYLLMRWLVLTAAIAVTLWLMQGRGLTVDGGLMTIAGVAVVYALVNAFVRPILTILTCPLVILTLGLFLLVINALMLRFTAWIVPSFQVSGFWPAFWGALVISIVSAVLTSMLHDETKW